MHVRLRPEVKHFFGYLVLTRVETFYHVLFTQAGLNFWRIIHLLLKLLPSLTF
jgi:hypothetical protein